MLLNIKYTRAVCVCVYVCAYMCIYARRLVYTAIALSTAILQHTVIILQPKNHNLRLLRQFFEPRFYSLIAFNQTFYRQHTKKCSFLLFKNWTKTSVAKIFDIVAAIKAPSGKFDRH